MAKKSNARRPGPAKHIHLNNEPAVSRAEFNRVVALVNERAEIINELRANQETQFKRLAQLQAELDLIRRAWERLRLDPS